MIPMIPALYSGSRHALAWPRWAYSWGVVGCWYSNSWANSRAWSRSWRQEQVQSWSWWEENRAIWSKSGSWSWSEGSSR